MTRARLSTVDSAAAPAGIYVHWVGLAAVVLLAAVLRFESLPVRGFIYWDEAKFALEGVRLHALLFGGPSGSIGKTVGTAKPTHALLIALAFAVLGSHDYAPLYMSAAFGLLDVILVYLVARRLFDPSVALVASAFTAASEYELVYARSGLSETDASVLFLLGVLLWVRTGVGRSQARWPALAGVLWGLAFTANYRLVVYIGFAVMVDLAVLVGDRKGGAIRRAAARAVHWASGLLVVPLLWQVVDLFARRRSVILFRNELTGRPNLYWQQVVYQLHEGKQAVIHFQPVIYIQWYVVRQGIPLFLLLLAAVVIAVRVRRLPWMLPVILVLGPWLIYVFAPFVVPRNLTAALPFAAILEAAALVRLARRVGLPVLWPPAAVALVVLGAGMSSQLLKMRSGFASAAAYVRAHGGQAIVSNEILRYYLGATSPTCDAPAIPTQLEHLQWAIADGYRFAVIDHHLSPVARYILARAPVVARFPAMGTGLHGENFISSENGNPLTSSVESVRVLSISGIARGVSPQPITCSANRVI